MRAQPLHGEIPINKFQNFKKVDFRVTEVWYILYDLRGEGGVYRKIAMQQIEQHDYQINEKVGLLMLRKIYCGKTLIKQYNRVFA